MIRVLIADEEKEFNELLREYLLREHDIQILGPVENGLRVMELIEGQRPDVVLLGAIMPGLDGMGVLERVKNMEIRPKVILLTGIKSSYYIQRAYDYQVVDVLLKPFDMSALIDRIRYAMSAEYEEICKNAISRESREKKDYEIEVTNILHQMGVPAHVKGYQYLRDAILYIVEDNNLLGAVTKELYPMIGEKYNTSASRVERAIRHGIELAWNRGNVDMMIQYFGYTINTERGKPTNSEFIAMISDKFRLQLKIS